jgi:exodeoxyribonuclease VIII
MHVMLDLETFGTRPDASIVQIGAVAFEFKSKGRIFNDQGFNQYVKLQDGAGSIDHSTLQWWLQQPLAKDLGKKLEQNATELSYALSNLDIWLNKVNIPGVYGWRDIQGVWAKPSDFDIPILKSAYYKVGRDVPWDRRVTYCARTFLSVAGTPKIDWTGLNAHDAFDDAVGQAMLLQKALELSESKGS